MNIQIYIYGNLGDGYTQYPDDYAQEKYQKFYARSTKQTQIVIHRDGNLMYYGYIHKLDDSQYIGFCVLLNGAMFTQVEYLFSIYENAITDLVSKGKILELNATGNIVPKNIHFNDKLQEIEDITTFILNDITKIESLVAKLPPVNYRIANNEYITFSSEDNNENIINASYKYPYTYIYKEKTEISINNNPIKKHNRLDKQKRTVTICLLISLIAVIGIISLNYQEKKSSTYIDAAREDSAHIADSIAAIECEVEEIRRTTQTVENKIKDVGLLVKLLKNEYKMENLSLLLDYPNDPHCIFLDSESSSYDRYMIIYTVDNQNLKIIDITTTIETSNGETAMICVIDEVFKSNNKNKFFIIGNNNANSIYNGDDLLEIDVSDFSITKINSGRKIVHEGNRIKVTKAILIKEGSCNAENEYRYTDTYYDLNGKLTNNSSTASNNVFYNGTMVGFPITMNMSIDENGNICGQYKNIRYGTTLELSGTQDSNGTMNITATNKNEKIYFILSRSSSGTLDGYGSNGSNKLKVHLEISSKPSSGKIINLKGKIDGKYGIVLQITENNGKVSGDYYYTKYGSNNTLSLTGFLQSNGTMKLTEYNNKGENTGFFDGTFDSDNFYGTYTNYKEVKMPFKLYRETTAKNSETTFNSYHNPRFNYVITYPSFLDKRKESANGDGCKFYMDDNVYLVVSGMYNSLDESIKTRFNEYKSKSLVYTTQKDNWFVVSDYTPMGISFTKRLFLIMEYL